MENLSYFVVVNKSTNEEYSPCNVNFLPEGVNVYDPRSNYDLGGWTLLKNGEFEIQKREHTLYSTVVAEEIENSLKKKAEERENWDEKYEKIKEITNELKSQYPLIYKEGKNRMVVYLANASKEEKQNISNLVKLVSQFTKEFGINGIADQITGDLYSEFVKYANDENNPFMTYKFFKACIYSNIFDELKKEKMKELE